MLTWLWILGVTLYLAFCLWRLSTVHGEPRERALNVMAMVWMLGAFGGIFYLFVMTVLGNGRVIVESNRFGEMWAEAILFTFIGVFGLWRIFYVGRS